MTRDTLLFRQVNPGWIREGRVTSQAFKPTAKDGKKLSVYDGDQVMAQQAYVHYTSSLGLPSVGVMAVNVHECGQQSLPVTPDPVLFPEHVVIDFRDCSNTDIKTKAKYLTRAATLRGWQYRVEPA